jgi:aryl-alcohol dehydrogenase-like predicted oxidoreductase
MYKNKSKICIGCEPLGGHNWGKFEEKKFEKLFSSSYSKGINFYDTAAIYGLGKSEIRLKNYLGKNIKNCFISTKGGIKLNKKKIIIDGSLEFIKNDLKKSLERLGLKNIYLYSIHHYDNKQDYRPTLDYLTELKKKNVISNIGVGNISIEDFIKLNKIYKIDYLQIPINIFNFAFYNDFAKYCKKFDVKILPYNILLYGLLSKTFDEIESLKKDVKINHRLKTFLNSSLGIKFLKKFISSNQILHKEAITKILKLDLVESVILGMSNINQLKKNLKYISLN